MTEPTKSKYWLDQVVADVQQAHPKGEIVVSSGIAPSGSYHVGHFREVLTADAIRWALEKAGRKAVHLHVVDNMDPLRKRYPFLPADYEQYVGKAYCLIPDPTGDCHDNYADHFFAEFEANAQAVGIKMTVISSYEDQYQTGKMTPYIETVLRKLDVVHKILSEVSGRQLESDWTPIQIMDETGVFKNARASTWNEAAQTIDGVDYTAGQAKLNWRLDWPARWALQGVMVEPFGRELATKGGSYDTGARLAREVFEVEPPYPIPYDTINLPGDSKKMSSSIGNLITQSEALQIMPPEILRYFVIRSRPDRKVLFDSGLGLYNLIDEYSKLEAAVKAGEHPEFEKAFLASSLGGKDQIIAPVPFSHLVAVYQAAQGNVESTRDLLVRTGYEKVVQEQFDVLKREFEFAKNWLSNYAPDSVKFEVQKSLPKIELSEGQRAFLEALAANVEKTAKPDGEVIHNLIYEAKEATNLPTAEAFKAIYRVILGKDSGPKAGWFLATLDRDWLIKRLKLQS